MTEQERRPDHTKALKSPGASNEEDFKPVCFVVLVQRVSAYEHLPFQEQQEEGGRKDGLPLL